MLSGKMVTRSYGTYCDLRNLLSTNILSRGESSVRNGIWVELHLAPHNNKFGRNVIERNTDVNVFNIEQGISVDDTVEIVNQYRISAIFCADSEFKML